MKIAFIGGGNMARALVGGIVKNGGSGADILVVDPFEQARLSMHRDFNVVTSERVDDALCAYDVIVLATKPQTLQDAIVPLKGSLSRQLIISIAAGIRTVDLSAWLGGHNKIIRAMPNTPALIGKGVTGMTALEGVSALERQVATDILAAVGSTVWLDAEADIDAVTSISGSGPAYVFYFIEALQEAGAQMGLDIKVARDLAVATFVGASELASQAMEPIATLRENVTSKGGTTAAALESFNKDAVAEHIKRGVFAARIKSEELGILLGQSS